MSDMTRRRILQLGAVAGTGLALPGLGEGAPPAPRFGVQLWTVRDLIPKDPEGTLRTIAKIGYREIEVLHPMLTVVAPICKRLGLAMPAMHIDAALVTGDDARKLDAAIADAKREGIGALVVAYLQKTERAGGLPFYRRFTDQMNAAGERIRKAGLSLAYHHHGFEFEPIEGVRPFDLLAQRFDKALVKFEVDVFWVAITGADPVAEIRKLAGRVSLVHLKEKARDAARQTDEAKVKPSDFVSAGEGSLNFPAIIAASKRAGAKHFFVEQDESPDPLESLRKSFAYLRKVKA